MAMVALFVLVAVFALAILGNTSETVQRYSPGLDQDYDHIQEGPSGLHYLGTDNLGRDTWARVLEGTLISLQVGLGVQVIVLAIGLLVGGLAALGGRTLDNIMMRITDLAYAFPDLLAIILLRAVFADRDLPLVGHDASQRLLVIFAISFVAWVTIARLIRGQMLSLKERDFVIAARSMGATSLQIVFKHMLPNTLGPVIVAIVFGIPLAIFAEAVLGFIGFGLPPPTASLGRLISDGYAYIRTNLYLVMFPAGTLAILMLCFTFLGDGLRDALDPRAR
ncbi:MAG: ABC transporter permease [Chloroflexi bacterium]|nr:MAG: ABC transporter permease [Chloroflexota bacterium]TMG07424.1 MAG: ABC transporter permease [Chloroflexota bacterium]